MMKNVATASPSVPPCASPRFQPKYIPEITYPTPRPHNIEGVSVRFSSCDDNRKDLGIHFNRYKISFQRLLTGMRTIYNAARVRPTLLIQVHGFVMKPVW